MSKIVDFRAGYVPPGVYVTADTSSVATAVGVSPTVVCLVGPGLGYRSFIDHVTFSNNTDSRLLTNLGINQASIVVSSVANSVVTTYALGTDYTLTATDASLPDSSTTIAVVGSGSIVPGVQINISYHFADTSYFSLNQFIDFASFTGVYGTPFNPTTGALQSPISLAAQIAFENGANRIYAVAPNTLGSLSDQYNTAYALTASHFDINLLVPVFAAGTGSGFIVDSGTFSPYATGLSSHLQTCDNAGYPRNAIIGLPENFSASITPDTVAQSINYRRIVLVWPNQFSYYNSVLNTTQTIGGSYLAAACAGILANNPINQGLTRRQVHSLSGIAPPIQANQTVANKNIWSASGVAVLELNRVGQLVIRQGTTTDNSSVTSREFNIVRSQDGLFVSIQQSLDQAELIGTPITTQTPLAVKGIIAGALEGALASNTIQGYNNLAVRQQSLPNGDPTVIECVFSYLPTYPLNYITVTFTLDLSTGQVSATSTNATDTAGSPSGSGA